jgi:UDP-4-amino-4,6-dideoxy-N-acetyl-beta-L-altrosamine N-acetyltransferase
MSKVVLRKINELDTANIVRWRNSESVKMNLFTQSELSAEQHLDWLKNKVESGLCDQYIIVISEDNTCTDVGTVFIKNIDRKNKKGEFGIFIGEESYRGKGYAQEATKQILEIGFSELNLNRIYLYVMSDNIAGIKAYKKAGFEIEGILKEDYLRGDKFIDIVVMGITKGKWKLR